VTTIDPDDPDEIPESGARAGPERPSVTDDAKTKKPDRIAAVKAWGDAATAVLKAFLLGLAIVCVAIIIVVVVWRDQHRLSVTVAVGPETQKTLRLLDVPLSLDLALIDALKERQGGVQQIIAVQGMDLGTEGIEADAISFKPVNLDLSAGEVTRLVRLVFEEPSQPTVRLELLCVPSDCSDAANRREASLLVHLAGRDGQHDAHFSVTLASGMVQRGLLQAIDQAADFVLEQNDPLTAADLFLNRAASQDVFDDQKLHDFVRAEGAAVAAKALSTTGCMADLVIGISLAGRGAYAEAVAAEQRAAVKSQTCKIQADTNIVFVMFGLALCHPDPIEREYAHQQVLDAESRLPLSKPWTLDNSVWSRVPVARAEAAAMKLSKNTSSLPCVTGLADPTTGGMVAERLQQMLKDTLRNMPSKGKGSLLMRHEGLEALANAAGLIPLDDPKGRLQISRAIMSAAGQYAEEDPHPRDLFALRGSLAMEISKVIARSASAAPDLREAVRELAAPSLQGKASRTDGLPDQFLAYTNIALIEFQNAAATTSLAPLVEPTSDVELLKRAGDVWYVRGNRDKALELYSDALDNYRKHLAPLELSLRAAGVIGRLAAMHIEAGTCSHAALRDAEWGLGDIPRDLCGRTAATKSGKGPWLQKMKQFIAAAVEDCAVPQPPGASTDTPLSMEEVQRRFDLLECLDDDAQSANLALSKSPLEIADADITLAFSGQTPDGMLPHSQ
jgi:tetratricopeptide (TPR) repeat protein